MPVATESSGMPPSQTWKYQDSQGQVVADCPWKQSSAHRNGKQNMALVKVLPSQPHLWKDLTHHGCLWGPHIQSPMNTRFIKSKAIKRLDTKLIVEAFKALSALAAARWTRVHLLGGFARSKESQAAENAARTSKGHTQGLSSAKHVRFTKKIELQGDACTTLKPYNDEATPLSNEEHFGRVQWLVGPSSVMPSWPPMEVPMWEDWPPTERHSMALWRL